MDAGLISRRYATVLYDFAGNRGDLSDVYSDACSLCDMFASQPGALAFLGSPLRKPSEKRSFVENVFAGNVASSMLEFILFTIDKGRVEMIAEILRVFRSLYKTKLGIKTAEIVTARSLSETKQAELSAVLEQKLNAKVEVEFKSDASLIGGIIITVDGKQIDCSVSHQLKEIEKRLTV